MSPDPKQQVGWSPDMTPAETTFTLHDADAANPALEFEPGELLDGRFRIVGEVGRGGMGVVYEAVDEKLARRIALKCARQKYARYLTPEVRNASQVSHRNVCRIFEIHTADTRFGTVEFITMELLEGETLAHRLRRGRMPHGEAFEIARQLADGLAEAHRSGVIHGDIKTNNVILAKAADGSTRAVITDFGLARPPDALARGRCGTPGYMAPEIWSGGRTTASSDIYALGAVLFAMVAGRLPGHPSRPATGELDWEGASHRKPPGVNPKWDRILGRCLDPDPSRRYRDAGELAAALRPGRTLRRLALAAAALLLASATAVVTYRNATAPADTVTLALLPISVEGVAVPSADGMAEDIVGHLNGARRQFTVYSPADLKRRGAATADLARTRLHATHALEVHLRGAGPRIRMTASLADLGSGQRLRELKADYAPADISMVAQAVMGTITGAFHLGRNAAPHDVVSPAAYPYYVEAMELLRIDNHRPQRAIDLLEKAVALDPRSALPLAQLATAEIDRFLFDGGGTQSLERAGELVLKAKGINPDSAAVLLASGMLEEQHGAHETAIRDLQRAVELAPGRPEALRLLALAYEHGNRSAEAEASYRAAVSADPGYYRTYIDFGNYFYYRGDFPAAEQNYRQVIANAPKLAAGHMNLGLALMQQGRFPEAESAMLTALDLRNSADTLLNLGAVYYAQEKFDAAARSFQASLKSGAPSALLYKDLGDAFRQLGRKGEAASAYREGLRLAEAEIGQNPRQAFLRVLLGVVAARLGMRARAETEITQALTLEPENAEVVRESAIAFEVLGERGRALALVRDAPTRITRELSRNPDVKDLRRDPRFTEMLAAAEQN